MPGWIRKNAGTLAYWVCEGLQEACGVEAGFTTRAGGESITPFDGLNLGSRVGDDPTAVDRNWHRLLDALGADFESVRWAEQVHGVQIRCAGARGFPWAEPGTDGLIDVTGKYMLVTSHADCAAVYIAAPGVPVHALAHAGWKGTAGGIAFAAVQEFIRACPLQPDDLCAAISPCIHGCCYEIGTDVAEAFGGRLGSRLSEALRPDGPKSGSKFRLDIARANRIILENAGLRPERIFECDACTACHPEDFFSHRRDRGQTGRMMAWLRTAPTPGALCAPRRQESTSCPENQPIVGK